MTVGSEAALTVRGTDDGSSSGAETRSAVVAVVLDVSSPRATWRLLRRLRGRVTNFGMYRSSSGGAMLVAAWNVSIQATQAASSTA